MDIVVLPDELIAEILSYLSVKTLIQLRTVSKAWKTLISNPTFVNLHLQRSPRYANLTLLWYDDDESNHFPSGLSVFPVRRLLENPPFMFDVNAFRSSEVTKYYDGEIVGSYNGLVCFKRQRYIDGYAICWLNLRNLAMGTRTTKLGYFLDSVPKPFRFSFGYDNSTGTYKLVAYCVVVKKTSWKSVVKVFNLGDNNSLRKIQSFPVPPLSCLDFGHTESRDGVHLSGIVNWLALCNPFKYENGWKHINVEDLVILSLSLSTETYTQLLLPKGFNEVPFFHPILRVLGNYLCFSHDFRGTEFVIWQMREFGVRESWTQLIKVSYVTLGIPMDNRMDDTHLLPLYLSDNGDTIICKYISTDEEINLGVVYTWKDDRVERTRFSKLISWYDTMEYVESLVPIT